MKRLLSLIAVMLVLSFAGLEANGRTTVSLKVRDSFRQTVPDSITVKVFDAMDSVVYNKFRATDWVYLGNGESGSYNGGFGFDIKNPGDYRAVISVPGFVTKEHPFTIKPKVRRLDLGIILIDKAIELQAVDIVASKVKMVMKGDTLVYNATAFQLADGSMLDRLIEQLPGAKLDGNGRITVNGEFIESLLINGRDFFAGNPSVALQNLPAYTVNQVQVYRKEGDSAYLTKRTEGERKSDPLVMDVKLKKEFIGTYMANADVGYGTSKRYSARGFFSRFDDNGSLALTGNVNNISATSSPSRYRVYEGSDRMSHEDATTRSGGFSQDNSSDDGKRTIYNRLSYTSMTINDHVQTASLNFMPGGMNHSSRSKGATRLSSDNIFYSGAAKFRLEKVYLATDLTAMITRNWRRSSGESVMNLGDTFDESLKPGDPRFINRYSDASRSRSKTYQIYLTQDVNINIPHTNDLLNIRLNPFHQYSNEKSWSVSNRVDNSSTSILNDYASTPAHFTYAIANVKYTHDFPFGLKITPGYRYHFRDYRNRRMLNHFLPDSIMEQVPVYTDTLSLIHDAKQSFVARTRNIYHTGSVYAQFYLGKVYFNVNLPYTWVIDNFSDTRAASVKRHTGKFEPSVQVYWKKFSASYGMRKATPSATQLLDFTDDSDLSVIRKGNPDLHNSTSHDASLKFENYDRKRQANFRVDVYYNETKGAFSNAVTFDPTTGVSTIVTKNIDGNRGFGGSANYSRVFGKDGRFTFDASIRAGHYRSAAYASVGGGYTESIVHNTSIAPSVSLRYSHPKFMLNVSLSPTGSISKGNLDSFVNTNAFEGKANLGGSVNLPLGFYVETGASLNIYSGYSDPQMNRCETFWNAAVQNTFGKKKEWTVRLEGHDLLGQNTGVTRTVNAQGITELRRRALGRFVMLHLQYRFSYSPKKK